MVVASPAKTSVNSPILVTPKDDKPNEDDQKLQEDLAMLVLRLSEPDTTLHITALENLSRLIRDSTTSMASVPKPLKFMRPHYAAMKAIYEKIEEEDVKRQCADVISVLSMVCDETGEDCMRFRLRGGGGAIGEWGHEYVRHLSIQLTQQWHAAYADDSALGKKKQEDLLSIARSIVSHNVRHGSEVEAVDVLIEIHRLDLLSEYVEEADHRRVCLYLHSCAPVTADPADDILLDTAKKLQLKFKAHVDALRSSLMLNESADAIKDIFKSCDDSQAHMQMALLLGRHGVFLDYSGIPGSARLAPLNNNSRLSNFFLFFARDLGIMEPKTPDSICRKEDTASKLFGRPAVAPGSSRANLAAAFVNGFVNCGFGADKFMTEFDEANKWIHRNKEYGLLSATASMGLIHRWDVHGGLAKSDRFLRVDNDYIKAGTLLGIGICCSGVRDDLDVEATILLDHLHSDSSVVRVGSIFGLGLAYANSKRDIVVKKGGIIDELRKILNDPATTAEVRGMSALSLGFLLLGSADFEVAEEMMKLLIVAGEKGLADPKQRLIGLAIALICLATGDRSEMIVEKLRLLAGAVGHVFACLVDAAAFVGSGDVLKAQNFLHICSTPPPTLSDEDPEKKKKPPSAEASAVPRAPIPVSTSTHLPTSTHPPSSSTQAVAKPLSERAVAVLGVALIALGDDVSSAMGVRMVDQLARLGDLSVRRAVPVAMALLSTSDAQLNILEMLSKLSHDGDAATAHAAVAALGLVGAGTNNSRLTAMLKQLAAFYHKDQVTLMLVSLSQGLCALGKGSLTLSPRHSNRQIQCPLALAGLLTVAFALLDSSNTILAQQHYVLYSLVLAMQPKMLITVVEDEKKELIPITVSVRVGQAVDVVGQAGCPRAITGFQTHSTPVLLSVGERAELASDEFLALAPILEGVVILRKNPDYVPLAAPSPSRPSRAPSRQASPAHTPSIHSPPASPHH